MNAISNSLLIIGILVQSAFGSTGVFGRISSAVTVATSVPVPKTTRATYIPVAYQTAPAPKTSPTYGALASSALIYDVTTGQVLYEKNSSAKLPMASLTKLMAVLTIIQDHHNFNEVVTIPENLPVLGSADQKINIQPGEQFYLDDLLKATLIYSANDVANALAIWDAGSLEKFADKMNAQAQVWGLKESHFVNPTGLDTQNHYSSAHDLLSLSTILLQNPQLRTIVNTQKTSITTLGGKPYVLTTTNHDLSLPYVFGIKTGQTDAAGQCLILLGRNAADHEIITVVLNSPDRFIESKNMVNYAFNNYIWK